MHTGADENTRHRQWVGWRRQQVPSSIVVVAFFAAFSFVTAG